MRSDAELDQRTEDQVSFREVTSTNWASSYYNYYSLVVGKYTDQRSHGPKVSLTLISRGGSRLLFHILVFLMHHVFIETPLCISSGWFECAASSLLSTHDVV